ncbi:MAG: hypothetical protein ABIJ46_00245 [bacterium]
MSVDRCRRKKDFWRQEIHDGLVEYWTEAEERRRRGLETVGVGGNLRRSVGCRLLCVWLCGPGSGRLVLVFLLCDGNSWLVSTVEISW